MQKQRVFINGKKVYCHPVFSKYATSKDGEIANVKTGRTLKLRLLKNGYYKFNVFGKKLDKPENYYQLRFVYEAIKGVIPKGFEIDHIQPDKSNNQISNFELLSHKQNVQKSNNKATVSINIKTNEKTFWISIKMASIELEINKKCVSATCRKEKNRKTATSKKDGKKFLFSFGENEKNLSIQKKLVGYSLPIYLFMGKRWPTKS